MNYFDLFQLPRSFNLDEAKLTQTYHQLQCLTHPDKFASAPDFEKRQALMKNAQVNDGFQILKQPISRAEHLLALAGIDLNHEQQTLKDGAFLMQQMEWREALQEANKLTEIDTLSVTVRENRKQYLQQLQHALDLHDDKAQQAAANLIRKLKFVDKFLSELIEKQNTLVES
jgi:molecular chaperone HscB